MTRNFSIVPELKQKSNKTHKIYLKLIYKSLPS